MNARMESRKTHLFAADGTFQPYRPLGADGGQALQHSNQASPKPPELSPFGFWCIAEDNAHVQSLCVCGCAHIMGRGGGFNSSAVAGAR